MLWLVRILLKMISFICWPLVLHDTGVTLKAKHGVVQKERWKCVLFFFFHTDWNKRFQSLPSLVPLFSSFSLFENQHRAGPLKRLETVYEHFNKSNPSFLGGGLWDRKKKKKSNSFLNSPSSKANLKWYFKEACNQRRAAVKTTFC